MYIIKLIYKGYEIIMQFNFFDKYIFLHLQIGYKLKLIIKAIDCKFQHTFFQQIMYSLTYKYKSNLGFRKTIYYYTIS